MSTYKNKKGFTLIELLLVITAIGILSAIVLVALNPNKQLEAGRSVKRKADMDAIAKAIEQYVVNNRGKYPPALQSVVTGGTIGLCVTSPCTGGIDLTTDLAPYIAAIPLPQTGQYTITKTATGITPGYDASTIWATAGTTAPKLDLNFARDRQLVNAVDGSNPITFTRASTGTYVDSDGIIKTAIADQPRFTYDPITKSSRGLLIEDQRTNAAVKSEGFEDAVWGKANTTILANNSIAPDGNQAADGFVANVTNGSHYVEINPTGFTASTNTASSIFVKQGLGRDAQFLVYGTGNAMHGVILNFTTGVATFTNSAEYTSGLGVTTNWGAENYGNGWWRLWVSGYPDTAATNRRFRILLTNSSGTTSFTGDNSSSYINVWGAQIELGGFPTSYYPNPNISGVTTRSLDSASITGVNFTNWYNNANSTFYVSGIATIISNGRILTFDNPTLGVIFINNPPNTSNRNINGPASTVNIYGTAVFADINQGSIYRAAATITPGINSTYSLNGQSANTFSSPPSTAISSGLTSLQIGPSASGGSKGNIISRIIYWPNRLSDTILSNITK